MSLRAKMSFKLESLKAVLVFAQYAKNAAA